MQVGDLVRFKDNDAIGLIVTRSNNSHKKGLFQIKWFDGHVNFRHGDELEVISTGRGDKTINKTGEKL